MTDAEINRDLALAIGYAPSDVQVVIFGRQDSDQYVNVKHTNGGSGVAWRLFDFRRFDVIWPIAVRYHKMPAQEFRHGRYYGEWYCAMPSSMGTTIIRAETPEKAVALAVIAMHKEQ